MRSIRHAGAAAVLAVALAGCSFSVGSGDEVKASELANQVGNQLAQQMSVDSVSCPDNLPAKEGSEVTCTLTSEGEKYEVTVTSNGKDGDKVAFTARVNSQPMMP